MARDGQGNYIPPLNNWNPAVDGNEADADGWNQLLQDLSTALSQSLSSDGQTSMTGPLRMGGNRIQDLGEPTGNSHAVRRSQLGKGGNLASANNVDIPNEGALFEVTGTTDIKSLSGGFNGRLVVLRFLDELTIEHSDNLVLPNQSDITTKAGDAFVFYRFSGAKWAALYGTAATRDVVSSNADTSGGDKLVTQGWMGLGKTARVDATIDKDDLSSTGFFGNYAARQVIHVENAATQDYAAQLTLNTSSNNLTYRVKRAGAWEDEVEIHHTGNFPPIGYCYTQYPGTSTPSSLFGGTWTLMFNTEGVFFRTEGQGASSFGGGIQSQSVQSHRHGIRYRQSQSSGGGSRVLHELNAPTSSTNTEYYGGSETRPRNRTIRVWRKTAH